jgi:hypothetical protein
MRAARQRAAAVTLLGMIAMSSIGCEPRPGKLREQWEQSNGRFRVRVEIYDEGNMAHVFEKSCHLRLVTASVGSDRWRPFGSAYFSRCDQDLKGRVRFVNDRVAYVFMQWWYAVTTNEGATWSTWDVPAHLPGKVYYNPRLIEEVAIKPDGTGTMTLNPEGVSSKERSTLSTDDFGVTWITR